MSNSINSDSREPVPYTQSDIVYGKVIGGSSRCDDDEGGAAVIRPVIAATVEDESDVRLAASYQHRERCRISLLVLLSVLLVATLANIAVAVVVLHNTSANSNRESDSSNIEVAVMVVMYIFVFIECVLSVITEVVLTVITCRTPDRVLLRKRPTQGSFVCLCISLVFLMLFCCYSLAIQIVVTKGDFTSTQPGAMCIVPAFRILVYLGVICVLAVNRSIK